MKCPTPETYMHLGKAVAGARFPQHSAKIQANLEAVFKQIEHNLNHPYHLHKGSRPTRDGFGTDLPKGQRDETMLRNFLIAELFRSWYLAFNEVPPINNKDGQVTRFVVFAEEIFDLLGIGKIIDHLEEFQSFRAKSLTQIDVNEDEVKK